MNNDDHYDENFPKSHDRGGGGGWGKEWSEMEGSIQTVLSQIQKYGLPLLYMACFCDRFQWFILVFFLIQIKSVFPNANANS